LRRSILACQLFVGVGHCCEGWRGGRIAVEDAAASKEGANKEAGCVRVPCKIVEIEIEVGEAVAVAVAAGWWLFGVGVGGDGRLEGCG